MVRSFLMVSEATGYLIGSKITDKVTRVSKNSKKTQNNKANGESEAPKERHISPEKRQQTID